MNYTRALVPLKPLAHAKTRLAPVLSCAERAALSLHMAADVLAALTESGSFDGIDLLTADQGFAPLARRFRCRMLPEARIGNWCQSLGLAAGHLHAEGTRTLLVAPGDLPELRPQDVRDLMARHAAGITLCPAQRDGGTNAMVLTPPDAVPFLFGPDSAQRHLRAATDRGVPAMRLELPAFARDIDAPDDLRWFCRAGAGGETQDYLERSGIAARLCGARAAAAG